MVPPQNRVIAFEVRGKEEGMKKMKRYFQAKFKRLCVIKVTWEEAARAWPSCLLDRVGVGCGNMGHHLMTSPCCRGRHHKEKCPWDSPGLVPSTILNWKEGQAKAELTNVIAANRLLYWPHVAK